MTSGSEHLTALKCGSCGGGLVKSYRVEYDSEEEENVNIPLAKCSSCGKEYDQHTTEYYQLFADTLTADKDNSVFKLGAKGTLDGVEYEIVGRLRYQDEDEYEQSTWDEWFAVSADGAYHYFVEEDGEVHDYVDYTPSSVDVEGTDSAITFEGKKIPKSEAFVGRIVYAEGELSWKPEIGEAVTMYDFKKDGAKYTIEISEGEVDITRGRKIPYQTIVKAFGSDEHRELFDKTQIKRAQYRRKALIYLVGAIVALGMSVFSCLSDKPVPNVMQSPVVIMQNERRTESNESAFTSQVLYGPFTLDKGDSLYTVTVSLDESVQKLSLEWQSFRFMLIREDRLKQAVNAPLTAAHLRGFVDEIDILREPVESYSFAGDFWDEEGYDDEGHWHENTLSAEDDFVLDKAGTYYAYLELFSQKPRKVEAIKVAVSRVESYRYYLIIMGVMIALMFFNRMRSKQYNAMPFSVGS